MGVALVARGSKILINKGYGAANLEWDIPNTPETKFRIASLTKQFTAASILLLEERGKLDTKDPVRKLLPDAPASWDKVTIFHLLTHTSGIPTFDDFPDYENIRTLAVTPAQLVARFRDKPLDFEPGARYKYSNSGYALLSYLIEKVTGDRYEKFVRENLLNPLNMRDSGYDFTLAVLPRRASGYLRGRNGIESAGLIDMSNLQGAGGLYSTAPDLLKWSLALFGGHILKAASLEKMTTPFLNNYAMGLRVEVNDGHKVIRHDGVVVGFKTEFAYYPEDELTVIVLSNLVNANPTQIGRQLAAAARMSN
jgi:CubicO group peptidase (beta-lactamase class C family)